MIEAPGIELLAEPAPNWSCAGPLGDRVQDTLRQIQEQRSQPPVDRPEVAPPDPGGYRASGSCRPRSWNPAQPGRCPDRPETGR